MIAFIQDGEAQNEQEPAEVYPNDKVIKTSRGLVNLIASRGLEKDHGTAKVTDASGTRSVCAKFGFVTCVEHQKIERRAFLQYTQGAINTPCHLFASPDGKELLRSDDFIDAAELVRLMKQATDKLGPGVGLEEYEHVQALLREADELFAKEVFGAAAAKYLALSAKALKIPAVEKAREQLSRIDKLGAEEIAESDRKLAAKDFVGAYGALERTARVFKGTRADRDARSRLAELEKNPEAGEAKKIQALEQKARPLMEQAESFFLKGMVEKAAEGYRKVVQTYPATPSAALARERLKDIDQDPEGAKARHSQAMEHDCTEWLKLARDYLRDGLKGKAEQFAKQVLDKYPGSPYAKEAEKLLAEIRKR